MQAASARSYRGIYLPIKEGYTLLLSVCSDFTYEVTLSHREEPNATPFELLALLLFQSPELLTLWKLLELLAFGERSHHQFIDHQKRP